jgi:hypothetical protein
MAEALPSNHYFLLASARKMIHANNIMQWVRRFSCALVLWLFASAASVFADGMVVPQVYSEKVEIPDQQALICHAGGVERLVIETSFQGNGTNFAWVVPLPSAPEIKPVSEGFFDGLNTVFRPKLIHPVHPYFLWILFVVGVAFLGWRSCKDESRVVKDLPLCLLLSVGTGVITSSIFLAVLAFLLAVCSRLFARTPAVFAMLTLVSIVFGAILTFPPGTIMRLLIQKGLIQTLGESSTGSEVQADDGVRVVSVQRAGVFVATTIQGTNPRGVIEWLEKNGYNPAKNAEEAIRDYVSRGWVFVASKVQREPGGSGHTAIHPLAFTFQSKSPVYPTRLTAIDNGPCRMDLYVFGSRRATARHFDAARCDRVAINWQPKEKHLGTWLRVTDPEVLDLIGPSTVGTKLSGTLTPQQMDTDAKIKWATFFRTQRAYVYSEAAAVMIALNVALPLGVLGWLALGASRGGWRVDEGQIRRWRWRLIGAAIGIGFAIFFLLPTVEIIAVPGAYGD